ncbi:hypothetical protein [Flavobacterium sp.]|uniref:hypothetical protein n=1 Tax=Flavobacterium sp. TaxID=239 RepID=UPI002610C34B|nr:hypothetical protein [Flavobacterium sp.]
MVKPTTKIGFLVHTEYHIMAALSLIADEYAGADYEITIYQSEDFAKRRFQFEKNIHLRENISYKVVRYEDRDFKFNQDIVNAIREILEADFSKFFIFNNHGFLPAYLAKRLYKQGTEIALCPDGMKPYSNNQKLSPRWSFRFMLNFFKFTKANKLPFVFYFPKLVYAGLKEIGTVLVQFPESYENKTSKKVERIAILSSDNAIELVNNYFKFDIKKEISSTVKVIFFINQPSKNQELCDFEIQVLQSLQIKFPDFKLIIKLHPTTEQSQRSRFESLAGVEFITKSYPAELYIAELHQSKLLSFWSNACVIDNPEVQTYWLHPILAAKKLLPGYIQIKNPTKHITELHSIEQIK